jgi:hypothetical protein
MVAISLTHDNLKEMANRLRQFLAAGGTSIKQTHAYEALAKSLGYRDWNTLLGALPSTISTSQGIAAEHAAGAHEHSPGMPAALLLIDRNAMAAHNVTLAHIEAAFRREFPALLHNRRQWETFCHEQLPLRQLPPFRAPVISISLQTPEKAHFHDALMECVKAVAEPKWTFAEEARAGAIKFTFMFFPERDVEPLLPAIREALARLPAEITVTAVETVDPGPDQRGFGRWRADGVSYFVWAWQADIGLLLPEQTQLASMALKFNGDTLIRLRDVATLHALMRRVPETTK